VSNYMVPLREVDKDSPRRLVKDSSQLDCPHFFGCLGGSCVDTSKLWNYYAQLEEKDGKG